MKQVIRDLKLLRDLHETTGNTYTVNKLNRIIERLKLEVR